MHHFLYPDSNYKRNQYSHEYSLAQTLSKWIGMNKHSEKMFEATITNGWKDIAGITIHKYTQNISVSKKVLYLNISSAPLRNELQMNKEKLIKLINLYLKSNFITDIVFR